MSFKTELQSNNTDLQSILAAVNALPDAGSGGGGAAVETCTLTIVQGGDLNSVAYTAYVDGVFATQTLGYQAGDVTLTNVVKNTSVFLYMGDSYDWDCSGATVERWDESDNHGIEIYMAKIISDASITAV